MMKLRSSEDGGPRPADRGGVTGGIVDVLACPQCGTTRLNCHFSLGSKELHPGRKTRYSCERGHTFDQPTAGWVQTYDPDLVGRL